MSESLSIFIQAYTGYAHYMWSEVSAPSWHNYFYWLIAISAFFAALEWVRPWRVNQPKFRQDFWLDLFYVFFNFFLFSLIIYNAASAVVVDGFNRLALATFNVNLRELNPLNGAPYWLVLVVGFVVRDFIQWWIHRLLHYVPWLWEFHKVHHSVKQMGFAAHLRYHWMENVVYRTLEYLPLALLGIGLYDFFVIHLFTLAVGHFNHSNLSVSPKVTATVVGLGVGLFWGFTADFSSFYLSALVVVACGAVGYFVVSRVMRKLFNSPEMHIWHHTYTLPSGRSYGVNFGITLAIWDYLFKTAYIPADGRDITLGFPGDANMSRGFIGQNLHGFRTK